jgi:hypothetical protein
VIADTVRLGGGLGSLVRGGTTSNRRAGRNARATGRSSPGAPSTVYDSISGGEDNDDDVTARPRFAEWRRRRLRLAAHERRRRWAPTPSSTRARQRRARRRSAAPCTRRSSRHPRQLQRGRGPIAASRGQLRRGAVAQHDARHPGRTRVPRHPGSLDHTAPCTTRASATSRRAPTRAACCATSRRRRRSRPSHRRRCASCRTAPAACASPGMPAGATELHDRTERRRQGLRAGRTTDDDQLVDRPAAAPHAAVVPRARAQRSGRSFPTEVLTAAPTTSAGRRLLLVQGFDRLDRNVKGRRTRATTCACSATARRDAFSLGFDAASNEAVQLGARRAAELPRRRLVARRGEHRRRDVQRSRADPRHGTT